MRSQGTPKEGRLHLDYLDGVRALAALFVVLHHGWMISCWQVAAAAPKPGTWQFSYPLMLGHFAVSVFIVLSGYCLMIPIVSSGALQGGFHSFLRRRALRILPPYYAALLLSLLLILVAVGQKTGTHWDNSLPVSWGAVLANATMLQDVWGLHRVNFVFWSVAVEWQIYLLFPLLLFGFRRFGSGPTTRLTSVAALLGLVGLLLISPLRAMTVAPQYLALFAFGMLGAKICFSEQASRARALPWRRMTFVAWLALIGIIARLGCQGALAPLAQGLLDFLVGACVLLSLIALCPTVSQHSRTRALLGSRPLKGLGLFSYSIYLIHAPLLQLEWQLLRPFKLSSNATFTLLELLGVPLVLGCCYLFHLACERPFMRRQGWPYALARLWTQRLQPVIVPNEA